ncbi:MAG: DUF4012 domain-containing protein [Actinobacteria bacterium]|nr:DUF4012 domain-containing protein [Actinomycetota bacterium]
MLVETVLAGPGGFAAGAAIAYAAPEVIRQRAVAFRRAVAVAAAAGAVVAGATPTGSAIPDLVLPAALAAGVTLLAARTKVWTVTAVAGVAAAAAIGSPGAALGLAGFGIALATALTARRAPVATVVVGACVVNALLRLRLPGPHGLESLVAAVLLGVVCVSGYRRLQRQTRRRARRSAAVAGAVAFVLALVGAVAVAIARPGLERGALQASRGLAAARAADQQEAAAQLATSEEAFSAAAATLGGWWVRPAELVPVVSQHVRALTAAASTGRQLAAAGSQVARATDLGGIRIRDGQIPLEPIRALAPPLAAARRDVSAAVVELRGVRSPWLVGPVSMRLDDNLGRLADSERSLQTSSKLVEVLPDLLGAGGERRWFLAVQTPSEARATGGFIGNFGEITATDGRLALGRFGRIGELNVAGDAASRRLLAPEDYLARYSRFDVATTWQNVNLSPHFPSVAKAIAGLYPQSGGQPVQGVIAVDPAGIAAFLQLTGPLSVPSWPEPLTAENAEPILLYEQYLRFGDNSDRVNFLGEATRLLWQRITSGELPAPETIVKVLGPAVEGKHLLVSSLDDDEDAALASAGLNGELEPVAGDALAVITQNASANKIEWFLEREVAYHVDVDPRTGDITGRLRVTLRNQAPPAGLPRYLIGNSLPPLPTGTNRLYLSIYTPWNLMGATIAGAEAPMESEIERGRSVYSTYVDIGPQSAVDVELRLAGRLPRPGAYRLDLHAQPVVTPDAVTVTATSTGRQPEVRRLVLRGDERLRFWAVPSTGR